jgi:CubicO group peptidase (beta-lactamase class C family)
MILLGAVSLLFSSQANSHISRFENGLLPAMVTKEKLGKGEKLLDRMKFYKVPGVSIAVINDGKIEWAKGYGATESGTKNKVTVDTLFQAGSVSKSVAAMGALALVEQGKLSLEEDVNQKLNSWKVPENDFTKTEKVTLARILNHSAGLAVHGFWGYPSKEFMPTLLQVLNGEKPANSPAIKVEKMPGKEWQYSGGGYTVMQQLMIDVTKQPFPQLMKDSVLDKLGMKSSTFDQPLSKDWAARTSWAHISGDKKVVGRWHVYPEMAAAGLWTTPTDLARFAIDIQETFAGKSSKVLSQAMVKDMLTPRLGSDGLGVFLEGKGPTQTFFHSGRDEGFDSLMFGFVNSGQGVVIMANSNLDNDLMNEILRGIAAEYRWPIFTTNQKVLAAVSATTLKSYIGRYQISPESVIKVEMKGGQLFVSATDQPPMQIFPETQSKFIILGGGSVSFLFTKDGQGKVNELVLNNNGRETIGKRLP